MKPFAYQRADTEAAAIAAASRPGALLLAGGTTVVDLMRLDVMTPDELVDVSRLPFASIEDEGGGVLIGATVRNSDLAWHPLVKARCPVLAEALLSGASPQLRNLATTAGNLMQRTRCSYFRDVAVSACNKRRPGSGCAAQNGYARSHAILGGSTSCLAVHPSDMGVALVALDAVVRVRSATGNREIAIADFHLAPADHPEVETALQPGEIITHVWVPPSRFGARSAYVKVRDRASYAFALASAAAAVDFEGTTIKEARIALGGVATKPWRCRDAEAILSGKKAESALFAQAADAAVAAAKTLPDNAYKVELARRVIIRALERATGLA